MGYFSVTVGIDSTLNLTQIQKRWLLQLILFNLPYNCHSIPQLIFKPIREKKKKDKIKVTKNLYNLIKQTADLQDRIRMENKKNCEQPWPTTHGKESVLRIGQRLWTLGSKYDILLKGYLSDLSNLRVTFVKIIV